MKLKHVDDPMVETVLTKKAYKKGKKLKKMRNRIVSFVPNTFSISLGRVVHTQCVHKAQYIRNSIRSF